MTESAGLSQKKESITFHCTKSGGIAHIKVEEYSNGKDNRFLAGFDCDRAEDCGIRRSPFSGSLNYTIDCPIYIALAEKFDLTYS